MKIRLLTIVVLLLCGSMCYYSTASAQSINGSISGIVKDANDAAVPGATLTIMNVETGQTRTTTTNDEGLYRVDGLPIGIYSVKAEKSSFTPASNNSVQVSTGINTETNFNLGVGGVTAAVEVTDTGGVTLDTTQSQVAKTVDNQRIMELPGRNTQTGLALLNPGVLPNQNGRPGSGFVVNGNRSRSNNFTIDGANNNDQSLSNPRQNLPPEAIQEFQIITNTFEAEYGRNAGSYVNQITRSGTNAFHGTGFEAWNGNGLNSLTTTQQRCFNSNRASNPNLTDKQVVRRCRDVTTENIFGFTVGGPIVKNHTFFFNSMDFDRFRTTVSSVSRAALDATSRAALSANKSKFGSPGAIDFILNTFPVANDPTFAGGTLSGSTVTLRDARITCPSSNPNCNIVKDASGNPLTAVFQTYNRTLNQGIPYGNNFARELIKINTKINNNDQLSFRYLYSQFNDPGSPASLPGLELGQAQRDQSFTINDVYVLTPKLTNEARFTYSRRKIGFPENFTAFANGAQLSVSGALSAFNGGNANFPQNRLDNVYEWTENLGYTTGSHALKFGYNLLDYKLGSVFAPNSRGFVSYSSLNNLLADISNGVQNAIGDFQLKATTYEHSWFAQDDWRVSPDLTLNLGLRYEYVTVPFGYFSNAKPDVNNFGPRLGFAWNPKNRFHGNVVLRAGYGIAYDQVFQNILLNDSRNYPRVVNNTLTQCTGCQAFLGIGSIPATATTTNTIPGATTVPGFFARTPQNIPASIIPLLDYRLFAPDTRIKQPMSQQWTVSLQWQLGKNYVVKAEYIGTKGSNLVREVEQNYGFAAPIGNGLRLDPTRGSIIVGQGLARSIYHSGQFTVQKRFSEINLFGINFGSSQFDANYTYSAFINESDDILGGQTNRTIPSDPRNPHADRARSGFDQPHRFVMSDVWISPEVFRSSKVLNRIFSGWELSGVTTIASGTPFSILNANNAAGILSSQVSTVFLSQRVGFNPSGAAGTFTTANAAGVPVDPNARYIIYSGNTGIFGALGANSERTPSTNRTDTAIVKNIRTFGETQKLQLRVEITDLFNHRNFTLIPTNTLSATTTPASFLNYGLTNVSGRTFLFGARYFF